MPTKTLAIILRPRSFATMFGQDQMLGAIKAQIQSGRFPSGWLFAGETGSGKTTVARILAAWLQCPHRIEVGVRCKQCTGNGYIEINASELNTVDAIKELAQGSVYEPTPPSIRRVYILDEAQRITKQAQSVLLKYIEDAPDTTVWIICTTEPDAVLRPLRGRCMMFQLQPLRGAEADRFITWAAKRAQITRDLGPFQDIVHLQGVSSPRLILNSLEKYATGMDPDQAMMAIDSNIDTLRICRFLVAGEWGPLRSELAKAIADDARTIRGAVLGYLRAIMLNPRPSADRKVVVACIKELSTIGYQDENTQLSLLIGALWQCCQKF